ncbi:MAG: energy transducer TonB [Betaproteobacteria bacterium RIFCSPLOWO2_12_FULL_66_14]|nr:MAG: energy transducer TonB [Betaproteobacteria bacterium RIFCSPLOWO2_12_FULL_66_14]
MPAVDAARAAWLGIDPQSRVLTLALVASLALHGLLLSIRFQSPDIKRSDMLAPLEVVIVNSKTRSRPAKPEVLAQSNLDGGGNTDQRRRVRTPAPALAVDRPGDDVVEARRRLQELEKEQRQLLSQLKEQSEAPAPSPPTAAPAPVEPAREERATDLRTSALAMVRSLEGQVARHVDEYNKRPKKTFIGARAVEFRFAQYVEDWRLKIERLGNLNYPEGARGRVYGSLRLSVSINADGTLAALELERASGHSILDRAAERIVRMAAPYASFPADIRRDTDILVITRTWHFAPGDKVFSE